MKRKQIFQATATALFLSLLAGGKALAFAFNFTPIAISDPNNVFNLGSPNSTIGQGLGRTSLQAWYDTFDAKQKGFAINNNGGRVAYYANLIGGGQAIYTYTGVGAPRLIADTQTSSKFSSFGQGLSINKSGTVAFFATLKTGATGIYTYDGKIGSQPKLIAQTGSEYSSFLPGLSLNDKGEVAFSAVKNGIREIFKSDGSITLNITNCKSAGASDFQCPITDAPSINNEGMVGFTSHYGLWSGDENGINQIVKDSASFLNGWYREANISDNGFVSSYVHRNGSGQMLISADGSIFGRNVIAGTNFDPVTGVTSSNFDSIGTNSINKKGIVAFTGSQVNVGKGIFIGDDAVNDKIVGIGSILMGTDGKALFGGSTVTDLFFDREGLSDDNEISFWAKLANGIEGIFRANKFADSQYNPWLPNCNRDGATHSFCNVEGNRWFDPPTAYGFNYKMTSDSLFTSILDLPSNFIKPFTVAVGDILLGEFTAGDRIDFSQFAAELGALLVNGTGVKEFTVTGLDVDPNNPAVFPIKLASNTDLMSFDMHALLNPDAAPENPGIPGGPGEPDPGVPGGLNEPVPEPTTILGTLVFGAVAAKLKRQRASANKEV